MTGGLFFFALLSLPGFILDIPFSLYGNFVIEARHGFNTKTLRVWVADLLKGLLLSALLGAPLLALLLFLDRKRRSPLVALGLGPGRPV